MKKERGRREKGQKKEGDVKMALSPVWSLMNMLEQSAAVKNQCLAVCCQTSDDDALSLCVCLAGRLTHLWGAVCITAAQASRLNGFYIMHSGWL